MRFNTCLSLFVLLWIFLLLWLTQRFYPPPPIQPTTTQVFDPETQRKAALQGIHAEISLALGNLQRLKLQNQALKALILKQHQKEWHPRLPRGMGSHLRATEAEAVSGSNEDEGNKQEIEI